LLLRDPLTGDVTADPELYVSGPGVLTTRISLIFL